MRAKVAPIGTLPVVLEKAPDPRYSVCRMQKAKAATLALAPEPSPARGGSDYGNLHDTVLVCHDLSLIWLVFVSVLNFFERHIMTKPNDQNSQGRDARTGLYVPLRETLRRPATTVVEPRKAPSPPAKRR